MPAELAVALLGGDGLEGALTERTGVEVAATTIEDHLEVARSLGVGGRLVVGMSGVPWPLHEELHAEGSASLPAYTGVVGWHGLPLLLDRLAEAVAPGATAGAHVLVTAPDPGEGADPSRLIFLREVAEGIGDRVELPSRSVAWRGTTREPTAVSALTTIVEAHGKDRVVECPVAPGTGPDASLSAEAERLGARLACVDLGRGSRVEMLAAVVETVVEHEGLR